MPVKIIVVMSLETTPRVESHRSHSSTQRNVTTQGVVTNELEHLTLAIKRAIAEGDMAATHAHLTLKPGEPGRALADFFRLEDGKVVEHWDVIQPVPEESAKCERHVPRPVRSADLE
jgi:predicted SnoaL-like aldol condensation-catalyzing enzyme